jgi:hypothetical protein
MGPMRRFLAVWAIALLVLTVATAGLNYVVNPYDLFRERRIEGLNQSKPRTRNHTFLTKTYQIERAQPATVVLGTSRVYIGIDAGSSAWTNEMQPVYNYGIPGYIPPKTLYRTLQEAWATGHLQRAVVFLDVPSFLARDDGLDIGEDERRLLLTDDGRPNPGRTTQQAQDVFLTLLTMGALVDSAVTIGSQWVGGPILDVHADGTATDADFASAAAADGQNALFVNKNSFEQARIPGFVRIQEGWQGPMPNLSVVRDMIRFCQEHGISLTLIIGPMHADALELYRSAGLWPRIEKLKSDLASMVTKAGDPHITLWDFFEYSPYTTERVPRDGDRKTRLMWFWEPTHFRKSLGDIMMTRVFSGGDESFGQILTAGNAEARNRQVHEQQRAFLGWRVAGGASQIVAGLQTADRVEAAR